MVPNDQNALLINRFRVQVPAGAPKCVLGRFLLDEIHSSPALHDFETCLTELQDLLGTAAATGLCSTRVGGGPCCGRQAKWSNVTTPCSAFFDMVSALNTRTSRDRLSFTVPHSARHPVGAGPRCDTNLPRSITNPAHRRRAAQCPADANVEAKICQASSDLATSDKTTYAFSPTR